MEYLVIYSSQTGNTQKLALEIFEALPGRSKDIQKLEERSGEADTYFVGFWNDKGICGRDVLDFLEGLHGKNVALFGTCGMGKDRKYCRQVARRVEALIPEDNRYLGSFLCAGKVSPQALEQFRAVQRVRDSHEIRELVQAYREAMLHPDEKDLRNARTFAQEIAREKEERNRLWG